MSWIESMSASIDYMDQHLLEDLRIKDIANVALASPYYYQRTFYMLTGMSVHEYIRNRRLSLAAQDLLTMDIKIIDLAFKYGYESSEAFSRVFKKIHGENPSQVRKHQLVIKSFPKLTIQVSLKGDSPMNYRIEKKDGFSFYGITRNFSTESGENFKKIPKFWDEVMGNGDYQDMIKYSKNEQCIGVCMPMDSETGTKFDYIIGAFTDKTISGYSTYDVPAAEWAVFEVKGPIHPNLQDAWKRIFSEWFPSTEFKHADLPELEVYHEGDITSPDYLTEIWIPITK